MRLRVVRRIEARLGAGSAERVFKRSHRASSRSVWSWGAFGKRRVVPLPSGGGKEGVPC